jgi:hypothetical protein
MELKKVKCRAATRRSCFNNISSKLRLIINRDAEVSDDEAELVTHDGRVVKTVRNLKRLR